VRQRYPGRRRGLLGLPAAAELAVSKGLEHLPGDGGCGFSGGVHDDEDAFF
jgi:hypothetical protein